MKNPPHPGHSIKDACLDPLGLSVTDGAKVLGVARHTLSHVINGQAGISPEMAIRLEKAGWSNADHWLRLQAAYDLAQARRHEDNIKVRRYEPELALELLWRHRLCSAKGKVRSFPTQVESARASIFARGHVRLFRRRPPVRLTPHGCQRRKTAKLLELFLTCATWRDTSRDDTDNSPQGPETAF